MFTKNLQSSSVFLIIAIGVGGMLGIMMRDWKPQ